METDNFMSHDEQVLFFFSHFSFRYLEIFNT